MCLPWLRLRLEQLAEQVDSGLEVRAVGHDEVAPVGVGVVLEALQVLL